MTARIILLTVLFAVSTAGPVLAVNTASNTPIDNRASVVYDVSGVTQTVIESSPTGNSTPGVDGGENTTFLVDNKVDATVEESDAAYTTTGTGASQQVLTFTVTNDGNTVQDYSLSAADQGGGADPFGGTDNFNATGTGIFVDVNDNGTYEPLVDVDTYIDELAPGPGIAVFVVRDIPTGLNDGDVSAIILTAQTAAGGLADTQGADITSDDRLAADDPDLVQIVFADAAGDTDGARDGAHSDTDAYLIGTAQITIEKTSAVISDPFSTSNPKAIPGAIIEYTVTVSNSAGATSSATNIVVTDDLSTEITGGTVQFAADGYASGKGIRVMAPNINGGTALELTNTSDGDEGSFLTNTVTVNGIALDAGESATVTFQVEIL